MQGRRQDQIDTNERLTAIVLLAGLAGVIIGAIIQWGIQ